jgi:predicted enzyme involved in methoxymalonyl-ACP biosynthesis
MESAMMDTLVAVCRERGITRIVGYYYKTAKNAMVKDFYELMGFEKVQGSLQGEDTEWQFDIPDDYQCRNHVIKINRPD